MTKNYHETDPPDFEVDASQSIRMFKSSTLFNGQKEVIILHAQEQYRLRITRLDKLILTK